MMDKLLVFHDTWIVAQHNWVMLLAALGLGIWVGWKTSTPRGGETS